jgi:hypothetical protein
MGTYTTNLKLYKPDPNEFVDVDVQLNANLNIADEAVKRLLDYEFSNVQFPDVSEMRTPRARFFRQFSNSVVTYFKASNLWLQDSAVGVPGFTQESNWLSEDYRYFPPGMDLAARLVKKVGGSTAEVEWTGAFWEIGGTMELNTTITMVPAGGIPSQFRPTVNKYFDVYAGNTTTDFSMARLLFGTDGSAQFKRYGVDPSAGTSNENRIEFTGCIYNVEVVGT